MRWEGRTVSLGPSTGMMSWQCQRILCCYKRNSRVGKQRVRIEIQQLNGLRELGKIPAFTSPWFDSWYHSSSPFSKNKNMFLRAGKTKTVLCPTGSSCPDELLLPLTHHCKALWMRSSFVSERRYQRFLSRAENPFPFMQVAQPGTGSFGMLSCTRLSA